MKKIFESGRYLAIFASVSLFAGFVLTGIYGFYELILMIISFINDYHQNPEVVSIGIVKVIDIQLLSVIQYVMAVGIYELFIGDLNLPAWLNIKNIEGLKAKLASVIILILAVKFTEKVMESKGTLNLLYLAISIGIIIFVLTSYYRAKESGTHGNDSSD